MYMLCIPCVDVESDILHDFNGEDGVCLECALCRCSTLTHLSLSDCGLGHVAAHALAAVLVPDIQTAAIQQATVQGVAPAAPPTLQPQLQHLNISKNPLGGAGLAALCEGIATCKSLQARP